MDRPWPPLTVVLKNKQSPVRRFLDNRFPNMRDLQERYRQQAGSLVVPDSSVNAGTLGGAFDWLIRFMLHPQPDLHLAFKGVRLMRSTEMVQAFEDLADKLEAHQGGFLASAEPNTGFKGPAHASEVEPELLARGCWALALLTEVFRAGLRPGSPLPALDPHAVGAEDLLAIAPDAAVHVLGQLRGAAEATLLPALSERTGPWFLGPTFDGSRIMNADADVIAAGLLLEIKTSLGRKRRDGSRQPTLDAQTVQQLVGYCLLDFSDRFELAEVGLYSARYAHMATWPLNQFLEELADRRIDLGAERAAFQEVLVAGPPSTNLGLWPRATR